MAKGSILDAENGKHRNQTLEELRQQEAALAAAQDAPGTPQAPSWEGDQGASGPDSWWDEPVSWWDEEEDTLAPESILARHVTTILDGATSVKRKLFTRSPSHNFPDMKKGRAHLDCPIRNSPVREMILGDLAIERLDSILPNPPGSSLAGLAAIPSLDDLFDKSDAIDGDLHTHRTRNEDATMGLRQAGDPIATASRIRHTLRQRWYFETISIRL